MSRDKKDEGHRIVDRQGGWEGERNHRKTKEEMGCGVKTQSSEATRIPKG